jgi:hypothetical protein
MPRSQCGNLSPARFKKYIRYLIRMEPEFRKELRNMLESGAQLKEAEKEIRIKGGSER